MDSNTEENPFKTEDSFEDDPDDPDDLQEFLSSFDTKKLNKKAKQKCKLSKEEQEKRAKENLRKRTCEICSAVYSIPKDLQNHIRVKHTFEKPYNCSICDKSFAVQSTYALHRRRHLGIKPHLCSVCGKNFLRHNELRIHMRTHTQVRDAKCEVCSKYYSSVVSLKKHMLVKHTAPSEWKHECETCGKKCVSKTILRFHAKQHKQDRTFKCYVCEKGFYTNQNLKVHIRTHSADTKFNCEICSIGYRSNEALLKHKLKMHGIGKARPVSAPKHFCHICNEGFLQMARLEKHIRFHTTGEDQYPFKCEPCYMQYKETHFFSKHLQKMHDVKLTESDFKSEPSNNTEETQFYGLTYTEADIDNLSEISSVFGPELESGIEPVL